MSKPTGKPIPHGTANGYGNYGCRCEPCREAAAVARRLYRQKNRGRLNASSKRWRDANQAKVRAMDNAWKKANPDRTKAYRAKWYAANRARSAEQARAWQQRNPERARRNSKAWHEKNRQRALELQRAWKASNPEAVRAMEARRRARHQGTDLRRVTPTEWRRLCARHDHRCAYCGQQAPLTQDHVVPLARGGRHAIGNLLPACQPCNSSKRDRLLIEWRSRPPAI